MNGVPDLARAVTRRAERALRGLAGAAWPWITRYNRAFERPSVRPAWAPGPLLKTRERSFPDAGWPRETDSLCPGCVRDIRAELRSGVRDPASLLQGNPGHLRATIAQRGDDLVMSKVCPVHGRFEDILSIDPAFTARLERLHPGRDFLAPEGPLRGRGAHSVRYGRGSVLTVDLTNRCNLMCGTCFMDANMSGVVHELDWDDIAKILDRAATASPRRQMSVQLSGGEPTLSPHFLRAVAYAKEKGFFCVQAATNGVRFAQDASFAKAAKAAGMRLAYLQFDGVTNAAHAHRNVGNLFDVKRRAIEHLSAAGVDIVLVVTVARGMNDDQVGPIVDFAAENADKVTVVSFQPISFTGRDEDVSDELRASRRYTLSHLAHDVARQTKLADPLRDWFPLGAMGPFSDLTDTLMGARAAWGALKCSCHPACGAGTVILVNKRTGQRVPLTDVVDVERLLSDVAEITDAAQGRVLSLAELAVAVARNFDPRRAPPGFTLWGLLRQLRSQTGSRGPGIGDFGGDAREFEWRALFVAGMPFQDLYNYDARRTEMCIIPYGTPGGEISFCAYNSGIGWRGVLERAEAKATTADWYRTRGRHEIHAGGRDVPLEGAGTGTVKLPASARDLRARAR